MNATDPLPTRSTLLARVRVLSDEESWREFQRVYRGLIFGTGRRAGLDESQAEELVQDTFVALAAKMPGFSYRSGKDSFKGWLLQIVRWKLKDHFRNSRSRADRHCLSLTAGETPDLVDDAASFERIWEAEWTRHVTASALARTKRIVKPEHYAIYHLHVVSDRPVAEVCQTLSVSFAEVYLAKHRVGMVLRRQIKRVQAEEDEELGSSNCTARPFPGEERAPVRDRTQGEACAPARNRA